MAKSTKSVRLGSIPANLVGDGRNRVYTIDGLQVKNLTKPVKLDISVADCMRGKTKQPNSCAAALAATRQVPNCTEARVHLNRIFLRIGKIWWRGKIPNALRTEIAAFDKGGKFAPGEYIINVLSPSEQPTGSRKGGPDKVDHGKRGKYKRVRRPHQLVGVRNSAREEYAPRHK